MGIFLKIVNAGCDAALPRPLNRATRLSNIAATAGAGSYLFYAFYYAISDLAFFLPALIVICLAIPDILSSLYLNARGKTLAAAIVMNGFISVPVFINMWFFFGDSIGNHYFFILFSFLPVITIGNKGKWLKILLSSMNLIFFIIIYRHVPMTDLTVKMTSEAMNASHRASILLSLATAVTVFFIYQQALYQNETVLEDKQRLWKGHSVQ